ncbi:hypothetical protein BPIT_21980 [Candidatus Brocadia pituitae]|nr:hypothetical protein BPIT_21980 [Candidatus Brocadia pituitae]
MSRSVACFTLSIIHLFAKVLIPGYTGCITRITDNRLDSGHADVLDGDIWNYYLLSTSVKLLFVDDDKNEGYK